MEKSSKLAVVRGLCVVLGWAALAPAANAYYCLDSETGWAKVDWPLRPNDSTRAVERQFARKIWQDWIWRGSRDGESFLCPWNAATYCNYTWSRSKSVSTQWSIGLSVEPKFKLPVKFLGEAVAKFGATYGRTITTTEQFNYSIPVAKGKRVEPLIVQNRRWRSGDFVNADEKVSSREGYAKSAFYSNVHGGWGKWYVWTSCYNETGTRFGYWTDNKADGATYKSFNIWSQ